MEPVFVVISKDTHGTLRSYEVFTERRLADNFAEIKRTLDTEPKWEYFVIEGTVPEATEQRIERGTQELGAF